MVARLSDTEQTFDGLKDLIVKEQFIDSCPKDLAIHLRERAPETGKDCEDRGPMLGGSW